jgi:sulfur-oxidizing protein SoxY
MDVGRREILVAAGLVVLSRPRYAEGNRDAEHRPEVDLPLLSENPDAVPIRVTVNHPMEPDHFIRSIEIRVDQDPVPYKGKFHFTPLNGRAWVAFQMRSGAGSIAKVVAECSRHGGFVATRPFRVTEGGCGATLDPIARAALPSARLRLPEAPRAGEIVEIRTKVEHYSDTGLIFKDGKSLRAGPEFYVRRMVVFLDEERISEFEMTPAVSPNPLIRFPLKAARSGMLRLAFVNSEGRRWDVAQPLKL